MTYKQALTKAEQIGASKAEGKAHLAQICQTLAQVHAVNPALVYAGAVKLGIDGKTLVTLADANPVVLGDLMFVKRGKRMPQLGKNWIGSSISHATLRDVDLIPAFEEVLDNAGVAYERPASVEKLLLGQSLTDDEQEEVAYYVNEMLIDLLDKIAPDGTYFGAHPGDGSDFGFWETETE